MPLGPSVRRLFGPYERQVAALYRRIFIDLDSWAAQISTWVPRASSVLEVGCGEGALTERLAALYPDAQIVGTDVTPRIGRLFAGDAQRVRFVRQPVEEIAAAQPGAFDLVVLSDVLHHVPTAMRLSLLHAVRNALGAGGSFVYKDWIPTATPIHWACEASDRLLTGDSVVYLDTATTRRLLGQVFGEAALRDQSHVAPWRNNLALLVRPIG